MSTFPTDTRFFVINYLKILAYQLPVWILGGALFVVLMIAFEKVHPIVAILRAVWWGLAMWWLMGNFMALGLIWRRTATFPSTNKEAFRTAIDQACRKSRLRVMSESPDRVILCPKRALVKYELLEIWVEFEDNIATLNGPVLTFGAFKRALGRALAESV
ncbi:MAG TPA: hypothetical protein VGJ05_22620 [Fimbriiglobus sp.]|jgi:hypothetical protein